MNINNLLKLLYSLCLMGWLLTSIIWIVGVLLGYTDLYKIDYLIDAFKDSLLTFGVFYLMSIIDSIIKKQDILVDISKLQSEYLSKKEEQSK